MKAQASAQTQSHTEALAQAQAQDPAYDLAARIQAQNLAAGYANKPIPYQPGKNMEIRVGLVAIT